jgi:hypothetical protein
MEDNGLEPPVKPLEKPSSIPVYAINPTRAQFAQIFEAIQDSLSTEQRQTLCDIAESFEPMQTNPSGPAQNERFQGRVASTPKRKGRPAFSVIAKPPAADTE